MVASRIIKFLWGAAVVGSVFGVSLPQAVAQTFDDVHRCDELAAHPDDPGRWAEGVYDDSIVPGPAIKFCGDAVQAYPDTPRFHFQHARALWAGKRYDEAVEALLQAEEMNYGPAYAYLGDAYFQGLGGIEKDENFAVTLYQVAAEAGFAPAEAVLADIDNLTDEAGTIDQSAAPSTDEGNVASEKNTLANLLPQLGQSSPSSASASAFDPSAFSRGATLKDLYDGDVDALDSQAPFGLNLYLAWVHNYFAKQDNLLDDSCSSFSDPALAKAIHNRGMRSIGMDSSGKGLENVARSVIQMIEGGPAAMLSAAQDIEVTQNTGKSDASRLRRKYGCSSPVFQRLYSNLRSYLLGKELIMSPEVAKRVKLRKYSTAAEKSCLGQYDDAPFCECMTGELRALELGDSHWELVSAKFISLASLTDRQEELRSAVRSCARN